MKRHKVRFPDPGGKWFGTHHHGAGPTSGRNPGGARSPRLHQCDQASTGEFATTRHIPDKECCAMDHPRTHCLTCWSWEESKVGRPESLANFGAGPTSGRLPGRHLRQGSGEPWRSPRLHLTRSCVFSRFAKDWGPKAESRRSGTSRFSVHYSAFRGLPLRALILMELRCTGRYGQVQTSGASG